MSLVQGSITVRGTNRKDVARHRATGGGPAEPPRRSGRHWAAPYPADGRLPHHRRRQPGQDVVGQSESIRSRFEIEAPSRTNLKLSTVNGGEILVENIDGDIDVSNTNGGITLNNVAGSVNAGTTNGNVRATMTRVTAPARDGVHVAERHGGRDAAVGDEGQPAAAQRQR